MADEKTLRHEYIVNVDRASLQRDYHHTTGIYVRAKLDGKWGSYDIAELESESLYKWLRSRGGNNPWAEDVVAILLGWGGGEFVVARQENGGSE